MVTIATSTRPESREDALIRLADQARTSGVKLYQDRADGRFYASSRSRPGTYEALRDHFPELKITIVPTS